MEEPFAIHSDLSIDDLLVLADVLETTVKRGTWNINEVQEIITLHNKIKNLVEAFKQETQNA